jgi:acyl carrier protein phosphodiesterase
MEYSADALLRNYDEFEAHFRAFFPELVAHTDPYRR